MGEQPADATAEELEQRCGHGCLSRPDHDGPHFYGYIVGPHSYEGVKAERDALRDRVAALEAGIRAYVCSPERDAAWDDLCALLDTSHDQGERDG